MQMNKLHLGAALWLATAFWTTSHAQGVDFSGQWRPLYHEDGADRIPGPEPGD